MLNVFCCCKLPEDSNSLNFLSPLLSLASLRIPPYMESASYSSFSYCPVILVSCWFGDTGLGRGSILSFYD